MRLPMVRLFVEHQDSDYVKRLQAENDRLNKEVERLTQLCDSSARKAMYELAVNNELLDVMRENGIRYRISADLNKYYN